MSRTRARQPPCRICGPTRLRSTQAGRAAMPHRRKKLFWLNVSPPKPDSFGYDVRGALAGREAEADIGPKPTSDLRHPPPGRARALGYLSFGISRLDKHTDSRHGDCCPARQLRPHPAARPAAGSTIPESFRGANPLHAALVTAARIPAWAPLGPPPSSNVVACNLTKLPMRSRPSETRRAAAAA